MAVAYCSKTGEMPTGTVGPLTGVICPKMPIDCEGAKPAGKAKLHDNPGFQTIRAFWPAGRVRPICQSPAGSIAAVVSAAPLSHVCSVA